MIEPYQIQPPTGRGPRCYAYTRIAQINDHFAEDNLCDHERALRQFYDRHLALIGYEWGGVFRDAFETGYIRMLNRPSGAELKKLVRKRDCILVRDYRHGPADNRDLANIAAWAKKEGVTFHIVEMGLIFPRRNSERVLELALEMTRQTSTRQNTLLKWKKHALKLRGYWTVRGNAPLGFRIKRLNKGRRKLLPDTLKIVVGDIAAYAVGPPVDAVVEAGVLPDWTPEKIAKILDHCIRSAKAYFANRDKLARYFYKKPKPKPLIVRGRGRPPIPRIELTMTALEKA